MARTTKPPTQRALAKIYDSIDLQFEDEEAARDHRALRGGRRAAPRARLPPLDRLVRTRGRLAMSFTWPLALVSLIVVPALLLAYWLLLRRRRKRAVATPASRCCARPCPGANGGAAPARRPAPRRPRRPRRGRSTAAHDARRRAGADVGDPRARRLWLHVLPRCEAQPLGRRTGRGPSVRRGKPRTADGPGCLLGVCGADGSADTTRRRSSRRSRASRRPRHGDRLPILKGLDAIAEVNPSVPPGVDAPEIIPLHRRQGRAPGSYVPDIIVLLTDGRNTRGIEPLDAVRMRSSGGSRLSDRLRDDQPGWAGVHARAARRRRLRPVRRRRVRRGGFGGGFGGFLVADHPTLKEIAARTGGTYHAAKDADQLQERLLRPPPTRSRRRDSAPR